MPKKTFYAQTVEKCCCKYTNIYCMAYLVQYSYICIVFLYSMRPTNSEYIIYIIPWAKLLMITDLRTGGHAEGHSVTQKHFGFIIDNLA